MIYPVLSLLLNVLVTALLAVTIYFCLKLNRRIRVLQDSKSELAHLIEKFDLSTQQATYSIQEIHKASKRINENIQAKLDKANYLADDLAFMIEKAGKMADRMDGGGARAGQRTQVEQRARTLPREKEEAKDRDEGDLNSLAEKLAARQPRKSDDSKGGSKNLDSMMDRLSELQGAKSSTGKKVTARPRSRSEQELMEALKTETKA